MTFDELRKPTALVIDEDGCDRWWAAGVLERDGWRVTAAPDGTSGLVEAWNNRPDVVVVDLFASSGVEGITVVDAMWQMPRLRRVPVVVMSECPDLAARQVALAVGVAAWVAKPLSPERLRAACWDRVSDPVPALLMA